MGDLSKFCSCSFIDCELHPRNHNKGCAPCVSKNLGNRQIPNCFFNLVDGTDHREGYSFNDFAHAVLNENDSIV